MTRIKFCGLTRPDDVDATVRLGADAAGFVLVPSSVRFIPPATAAMLRARLGSLVQAVALFKDASADEVAAAVAQMRPDLLQFHGDEPPEFCRRFGTPYMKAVPMGAPQDLAAWARRYGDAAALLLDGHAPGELGGQGRTFDWRAARAGAGLPLVLAGGLRPDNVGDAVRSVQPYGVDVSSGVESASGVKDHGKMALFIQEVRRADAG
jgi:phosphoribosylanthranilate isomerase